jgi:hypothetical protein|tara:strand:+ start:898 stop:1329 length:432 start_codon:yes stop_codon:yes gene_type:complete
MAERKKTTKRTAKKKVSEAVKKKTSLEDLQNFTTGRLDDDAIEKVKKLEEVLGIKTVNPFGTNDPSIFEQKLKDSNLSDLQSLAMKVGIFPDGVLARLKQKLRAEFKRATKGARTISMEDPLPIHDPSHPNHERAKKLMGEGF